MAGLCTCVSLDLDDFALVVRFAFISLKSESKSITTLSSKVDDFSEPLSDCFFFLFFLKISHSNLPCFSNFHLIQWIR